MSITYQYLSGLHGPYKTKAKTKGSVLQSVGKYLKPKRLDEEEIASSSDLGGTVFLRSLFIISHIEVFHGCKQLWTQYESSETAASFVTGVVKWLPRSPEQFQAYFQGLKKRVGPVLIAYHTTFIIQKFFEFIASTLISKSSMGKMLQNPARRSTVVTTRQTSMLLVAGEMFVVTLWSNLSFFLAQFVYKILVNQLNVMIHSEPQDLGYFLGKVRHTMRLTTRKYLGSCVGGAIVSSFWSCHGTLLGIAAGEAWYEEILQYLVGLLGIFGTTSSSTTASVSKDTKQVLSDEDVFTCGCCQTTRFSSNPNHPSCAPVSSRSCDHSMCKLCVESCQMALMERLQTYQEWIRCPFCSAKDAFSAKNHLVNRGLCAAIGWTEQNFHNSDAAKLQDMKEVD